MPIPSHLLPVIKLENFTKLLALVTHTYLSVHRDNSCGTTGTSRLLLSVTTLTTVRRLMVVRVDINIFVGISINRKD